MTMMSPMYLVSFSYSVPRDIQRIEPNSIDCYGEGGTSSAMPSYWHHGLSILNFMRVSHIPGLSRLALISYN